MSFYILWNTPYPVGGVTSFCVHLHLITGAPIIRLSKIDQKDRPLGEWGVSYRNMTLQSIRKLTAPILLGGGTWTIDAETWGDLMRENCVWTVLHDETEFRTMPHTSQIDPRRVIVMREHNLCHYPTAVLLPQPYQPRFDKVPDVIYRTIRAISTARLDKIKGTERIVLANRLLPDFAKVRLLGSPNRMWVFSKKEKLPELQDLSGMPSTFGAGADMHRRALFGVDMTEIGNDRGVQYTLLEALDGGSIPIVSPRFAVKGLEQLTADSPESLARVLTRATYKMPAALANRAWLDQRHAPAIVAPLWERAIH